MATKSVKTTKPKTSAPKVARSRTSESGDSATVARERIAVRAYELWCDRGHQHGHDVEDWLTAEHELGAR